MKKPESMNPTPADFAASVIVGRKPTTAKPPRRKSVPLPPATYADRYADMLLGTIKSKRDGIPETFREDSQTFVCHLQTPLRDELQIGEALEAIRAYAAELHIYFASVSRVEKKRDKAMRIGTITSGGNSQ